jgi:hypothetical protein
MSNHIDLYSNRQGRASMPIERNGIQEISAEIRGAARDSDRPGPSNIKREPLELRDDSNFSNM